MLVAILRYMGHPVRITVAYGLLRHILALDADASLVRTNHSGYRLDQLRLTVAVDSCDTDDLARPHLERNILHNIFRVALLLILDGQPFYFQNHVARLCLILVYGQIDLMADHHLGKRLLVRLRHLYRSDIFSTAEHRAPVCDRLDFIQLVSDKYDGFALAYQLLHNIHQFVDLLRR